MWSPPPPALDADATDPMVPSGVLSAPAHPLASRTDTHDAVLGPVGIAVQEGATTQGQDPQPHQQSHNKARSFPITPFFPKLLLLSGKFLLVLRGRIMSLPQIPPTEALTPFPCTELM